MTAANFAMGGVIIALIGLMSMLFYAISDDTKRIKKNN